MKKRQRKYRQLFSYLYRKSKHYIETPLHFARWKFFPKRPTTLKSSAYQDLALRNNPKHPGPIIAPPRTGLFQISFHADFQRLQYLSCVIEEIDKYAVGLKTIIVHTNCKFSARLLQHLFPSVTIKAHRDLKHPFDLTWQHRKTLIECNTSYDVYAYFEDDILLPATAFFTWWQQSADLADFGLIPGLLRVELDRHGEWVMSDLPKLNGDTLFELQRIGCHNYAYIHYPYQACWLATRRIFEIWRSSGQIFDGPVEWETRERAAAGPGFEKMTLREPHRKRIRLDDNGMVPTSSLVVHLPNNYGQRPIPHKNGLGTRRLSEIQKIIQNLAAKSVTALLISSFF